MHSVCYVKKMELRDYSVISHVFLLRGRNEVCPANV